MTVHAVIMQLRVTSRKDKRGSLRVQEMFSMPQSLMLSMQGSEHTVSEQGLGWMQSDTLRVIHWEHSIYTPDHRALVFCCDRAEVVELWWECNKYQLDGEKNLKWNILFAVCRYAECTATFLLCFHCPTMKSIHSKVKFVWFQVCLQKGLMHPFVQHLPVYKSHSSSSFCHFPSHTNTRAEAR